MAYSALSDDVPTVSQFTRRKKVTITTDGTSTPADYQVNLTITYKHGMQADFGDIRFNTIDKGYVDYWIESYVASTSAVVWVELPDAITHPGSDMIWMYYGNDDLSDGGDIEDTFDFGDDFPGSSIDTGKWDVTGTVSVADSKVSLNEDDRILGKTSLGYGYIAHSYAIADEQDTGFLGMSESIGTDTNSLEILNSDLSHPDNFDLLVTITNNASTQNVSSIDDVVDWRSYRAYTITRLSNEVRYYVDGNLFDTETSSTYLPTVSLKPRMRVWDSSQASTLTCDWIFVRKYIANEPIPTYSTVQRQRRVAQFIG